MKFSTLSKKLTLVSLSTLLLVVTLSIRSEASDNPETSTPESNISESDSFSSSSSSSSSSTSSPDTQDSDDRPNGRLNGRSNIKNGVPNGRVKLKCSGKGRAVAISNGQKFVCENGRVRRVR